MDMTEPIASAHNPKLKQLRKLHDRKDRQESGLFLAEGEDMLSEAARRGADPEAVFYDCEALDLRDPLLAALPERVDRIPVRHAALAATGSLGSGSRVIGVWRQLWADLEAGAGGPAAEPPAAVYLHEVADPGNVGAVVRSALALVPSVVIVSPKAADPFGPKAVRASMGAVFGQPIARATFDQAREALGSRRWAIALVPAAGTAVRELDLGRPALFALGAERTGLPDRIVEACDATAHVPLRPDGAESLNVAMTATLCLYECALHRLSEVRS